MKGILSRSTRCGCCSYQVSSISVRRVTCYDHFCVFQFFSILVVFMATAAILKFLSLKIMCTRVRQNFWKISSNSEHHSKPTMNINSQHHNLLGNQMSPKSEDFCIWWPFYTLVTMVMAAILNCFNPPKSCHILRWIFPQSGS